MTIKTSLIKRNYVCQTYGFHSHTLIKVDNLENIVCCRFFFVIKLPIKYDMYAIRVVHGRVFVIVI